MLKKIVVGLLAALAAGLLIACFISPFVAAQGLIRFAGASPSGLTTLVLYDGSFEVRAAGFAPTLRLQMEELSAALTLMNLAPRLTVNRQVFQYRAAEPRP